MSNWYDIGVIQWRLLPQQTKNQIPPQFPESPTPTAPLSLSSSIFSSLCFSSFISYTSLSQTQYVRVAFPRLHHPHSNSNPSALLFSWLSLPFIHTHTLSISFNFLCFLWKIYSGQESLILGSFPIRKKKKKKR